MARDYRYLFPSSVSFEAEDTNTETHNDDETEVFSFNITQMI